MKNELVYIAVNKETGVAAVYHMDETEFRNKCSGLADSDYVIYKAQRVAEGKCRVAMMIEWDSQ